MRALERWDERWNTGSDSVDKEHKRLFAMFSVLQDAWDCRFGESVINGIIKEMTDYCDTHFENEEVLMAEIGYPDLAHHRQTHEDIKKQVSELREEFLNAEDHFSLSAKLGGFLQTWLIQHILDEDQKIKPFMVDT